MISLYTLPDKDSIYQFKNATSFQTHAQTFFDIILLTIIQLSSLSRDISIEILMRFKHTPFPFLFCRQLQPDVTMFRTDNVIR